MVCFEEEIIAEIWKGQMEALGLPLDIPVSTDFSERITHRYEWPIMMAEAFEKNSFDFVALFEKSGLEWVDMAVQFLHIKYWNGAIYCIQKNQKSIEDTLMILSLNLNWNQELVKFVLNHIDKDLEKKIEKMNDQPKFQEKVLTILKNIHYRSPEDFRRQAKEKGIGEWMLFDCPLCGYECGFIFEFRKNFPPEVSYDSNCNCCIVVRDPNPSSWEQVATHYNRQSIEIKKTYDLFWGF